MHSLHIFPYRFRGAHSLVIFFSILAFSSVKASRLPLAYAHTLLAMVLPKAMKTRAFDDRKVSCPFLAGILYIGIIANGQMGQLTFCCRVTRTAGKM